jgi:hypothetical protein
MIEWMNEHGVLVEWYWQGKTEEYEKKKIHFVHHKSYMN